MYDFRYDPFADVSKAIIKKEIHFIPTTSPYIITLSEIPQNNSQSTTMCREVTGFTVEGTQYGITFDEVAGSPGAGAFRPDYVTQANNDPYWNTGKLQFNSADSGKLVELEYMAMGGLAGAASPKSAPGWAYDRGDGSDGDFYALGGEVIDGVKNYRSFVIPSGVNVRVGAAPLLVKCQTHVVIDGTLDGSGNKGLSAATIPAGVSGVGGSLGSKSGAVGDYPVGFANSNGYGGGGGGRSRSYYGGGSNYAGRTWVWSETPNSLWQNIMAQEITPFYGAAGAIGEVRSNSGASGAGGGTIRIGVDSYGFIGTLNVLGGEKSTPVYNSSNRGSSPGSGGGSIVIIAKNIEGNGVITVQGGKGGDCDQMDADVSNGMPGWYKIFKTSEV